MSKKYKILIDPLAKKDLSDIFFFVAINDNPDSANRLLDGIENTVYNLETFPERGHIVPEIKSTGIRQYLEILYKSYRIIYEIDDKMVYVHTVIDGRRNVQEVLNERLLR